jgi:hypothetical protein
MRVDRSPETAQRSNDANDRLVASTDRLPQHGDRFAVHGDRSPGTLDRRAMPSIAEFDRRSPLRDGLDDARNAPRAQL